MGDLGPEPVQSRIPGPPARGGLYHCVIPSYPAVLSALAVPAKVLEASLALWAKAHDFGCAGHTFPPVSGGHVFVPTVWLKLYSYGM